MRRRPVGHASPTDFEPPRRRFSPATGRWRPEAIAATHAREAAPNGQNRPGIGRRRSRELAREPAHHARDPFCRHAAAAFATTRTGPRGVVPAPPLRRRPARSRGGPRPSARWRRSAPARRSSRRGPVRHTGGRCADAGAPARRRPRWPAPRQPARGSPAQASPPRGRPWRGARGGERGYDGHNSRANGGLERGEALLAYAVDLLELVDRAKAAVLLSVVDDSLGQRRADPVELVQLLDRGGCQADPPPAAGAARPCRRCRRRPAARPVAAPAPADRPAPSSPGSRPRGRRHVPPRPRERSPWRFARPCARCRGPADAPGPRRAHRGPARLPPGDPAEARSPAPRPAALPPPGATSFQATNTSTATAAIHATISFLGRSPVTPPKLRPGGERQAYECEK